jgi:hypothetical protein
VLLFWSGGGRGQKASSFSRVVLAAEWRHRLDAIIWCGDGGMLGDREVRHRRWGGGGDGRGGGAGTRNPGWDAGRGD